MVSVGIDVSKESSVVCMMRAYGEVVAPPYGVCHTIEELSGLVKRIEALEEDVRVVMEATGVYHLPLVDTLQQAGIFVCVVNPLVLKKYASKSLRKGKTDKLDAIKIANYGVENWFSLAVWQAPPDAYAELRLLGRQYARYIEIKIKAGQALADITERTMPGIRALLSCGQTGRPSKDKLRDFVMEYWHFDNITCMSETEFVEDFGRWAKEKGYRKSEGKAKDIYLIASFGIPTLPSSAPSTKMLTLEAARLLLETSRTLETILSKMQEIATTLPEYSVVRSMPGVGDVLAPRLIAEVGDVRRFHSSKALIAYAGIDAPPFQSGSFTSTKRHISKRGSPLLRKTAYEVISCLKTIKPNKDNAVYQFLLKKEAEGKPKKVAKIAAVNKFLRIYFARVVELYKS